MTTEFVLLELGNYLSRSVHRTAFPLLVRRIRESKTTRILPLSTSLFDRGLDVYGQRSDKDWSLVDCVSFVVMRDHGIAQALTADHHFVQAGFATLLG